MEKDKKDKKVFVTRCPNCQSRNYVLSIFGAICPNCFYEEPPEVYLKPNSYKEKENNRQN